MDKNCRSTKKHKNGDYNGLHSVKLENLSIFEASFQILGSYPCLLCYIISQIKDLFYKFEVLKFTAHKRRQNYLNYCELAPLKQTVYVS